MRDIKITNCDTLLKKILKSKKGFTVTSKKVPKIEKIVEDFDKKYLADKYTCYTGACVDDDGSCEYDIRSASSIKKLMNKAKKYLEEKKKKEEEKKKKEKEKKKKEEEKKKKEEEKVKNELYTFYDTIIKESKVNDVETIEEKVKTLDKYFSENYSYHYNRDNNDVREALAAKGGNAYILCKDKDKKGICCDFAEAFVGVCKRLNIKARCVSGNTEKDKDFSNHVWSQVFIDGEWCSLDITWDVCGHKPTAFIEASEFNKNHYPLVYYNPKY